jgi:phosphotriesterase-related protein
MNSSVPTVRGPVSPDDLGVVLTHEHLFVRNTEIHDNFPSLWHQETGIRLAAQRLDEAYEHGVRTIVDMTVLGQGRNPRLVERVAALTRVNIVVATGLYVLDGLPQIFRYRGPGTPLDGPEPIVDLLEADITVGIAGTGIRAALVKFVCEAEQPDATVRRLAAAIAEVHRRTGAPVVVHTDPAGRSAMTACELLTDLGVRLDNVVLAHSGDIADAGLLRELAATGAFIGCDRLGMAALGSDEQRIATIAALVADGHVTQVLPSHDCASFLDHMTAEQRAHLFPDWDYSHLHARLMPALRSLGIGDKEITTMLEENPKALLTRQTH